MYGGAKKNGEIKLITREGKEYYVSNGETLPDGDFDLKIVGLTDGAVGIIVFK